MPVIARFYGILIKMYFREHGVPHFHALYGEYNAVFDVQTLEAIEGDLPVRHTKWCRTGRVSTRPNYFACGKPRSSENCRGWSRRTRCTPIPRS